MADGSDAIADWPLLNALVNTAVGRVVGVASTTAAASASAARSTPGMVCVADGTELAAREARPRAHRRPGHGRDPPRRRRLRARARGRRRARRADPDARSTTRDRPRDRRRSAIRCCASERARSSAEELAIGPSPAADRRHDRDDARRQRRRASPPTRSARRVRIAVVEVEPDNPRYPYKPPIPLTVVVNPVIEPLDDELVEINEGCLSVPDLRGEVPRHVDIRVRYLDRDGVEHDEVQARAHRRHVPARGRPPRRRPVPRPRARPDDAHDLGAVRALPPGRVRRARSREFVERVGS